MDISNSVNDPEEILSDDSDIRNCRFTFKCPKKWAELAPIVGSDRDIRFCGQCEQNVYRCETDREIAIAVKANRCIAIKPGSSRPDDNARYLVGMPSAPY